MSVERLTLSLVTLILMIPSALLMVLLYVVGYLPPDWNLRTTFFACSFGAGIIALLVKSIPDLMGRPVGGLRLWILGGLALAVLGLPGLLNSPPYIESRGLGAGVNRLLLAGILGYAGLVVTHLASLLLSDRLETAGSSNRLSLVGSGRHPRRILPPIRGMGQTAYMANNRTDPQTTAVTSTARPARGVMLAAALALALAATPLPAQTWTEPAPLNTNAASDSFAGDFDPHLATDGQGTWLAVWETLGGALGFEGDIVFARSIDGGVTWSDPAPLDSNALTDSVSEGLAQVTTDAMGTWVAVWWVRGHPGAPLGGDEDILFSRTTDAGVTWSEPQPVDAGAASDSGDDIFPRVITDGLGTWLAVWHSNDADGGLGTDFDLLIARSIDGGATWSDSVPLNSNAAIDSGDDLFPHVATDRLGNWVAIWWSRDSLGGTIGTDNDILFARSIDGGSTWSNPEPLTAATLPGGDTRAQVVTDGQGTWLAVWNGGTFGDDSDILFARSNDAGRTWSDAAPLNTNATTDSIHDSGARLATDGVGTWVTVWEAPPPGSTEGDTDLLFARSVYGGATWSDPAPLNINAAATKESTSPRTWPPTAWLPG